MTLQCNQCDEKFSSNFSLYKHKTAKHGPILGLMTDPPPPQKLNQVSENPDRFKRLRDDGNVGNPKKYRRVIDAGQESNTQLTGLKRIRDESSDAGLTPTAKYQKIDNQGKKRKARSPLNIPSKRPRIEKRGTKRSHYWSGSDSEQSHPKKYRHVAPCGVKRSRSVQSDESAYYSGKHRRVTQQGQKRYRSNSSSESSEDEEENRSKYRRVRHSEIQSERMTLIDRLKKEIEKWRRLYRREITRNKNLQKEYDEKIVYLDGQLKELKEFDGDYELTNISKAIMNSVTIEDFNRIRELISQNGINSVLRSRKYLISLQKLFLGLSYGIVPITTSQRVALSHDEKELVKKLENASADQLRNHIKNNKQTFLKLFSVISDSIKFVVKAYNRYGN